VHRRSGAHHTWPWTGGRPANDTLFAARSSIRKTVKLPERLPAGFQAEQSGGRTVVALPEYLAVLSAAEIDDLPHAGHGRSPLRRLALPDDSALLIRRYHRGGILRAFNRDRYIGPKRALREIELCREAAQRGVPVAPAVGAIIEESGLLTCRISLVTQELEEAIDLGEYINWLPAAPPREVLIEKRRIIEAVGRAVRTMHDAGLNHADLQVKNILVRQTRGDVEVRFIDLDRSTITTSLPERLRAKNLRRLNRSVMKMQIDPPPIDDDDRRLFLQAYRAGEPIFGADIAWLLRSCRRHAILHSITWRLFR